MPSVNVVRKNFDIQYRGSSPLTLNATNAPWINKILKIYRPSTGTALAVQSFAGSFNGATAGGALSVLNPGFCYRIVAAVYDGSFDIPDSVLVDAVTFGTVTAPSVTSFTPSTAAVGTSITITGNGFGATQGTSSIRFNGTAATATSWSDTSITASVPTGATNGRITVVAGGVTGTSAVDFTIQTASATAPVINNLLPNSAAIGSNIQISGTNLIPTNSVKFGNITATVVSATATQLTVTVPAGTADGNVTVTTPQGVSNGLLFTLPVAAGVVPVNLLFVGNSIVEGTQGYRFSDKVRALIPASWTLNNVGHGGWGIGNMETAAFLDGELRPKYNPNAGKNIIIFQEGSNETLNFDPRYVAWVAARRAEGWKIFTTAIANRTDISTNWLEYCVAQNSIFKNATYPGDHGDVFVDYTRVPKISRTGNTADINDSGHSANNPLWTYDKVHWTRLVHEAAGELIWDYLNNYVNGVPLPLNVENYPSSVALPGEAVQWVDLVGATVVGTDFYPTGTSQPQFGAGGRSSQIIYEVPGFCGAFQAEQRSNQSGFQGFGTAVATPPGFSMIKAGYLSPDVFHYQVSPNPSATAQIGDTIRIELYSDKTIWLRNGVPIYTGPKIPMPARVFMSFNGGVYGGIKDARIEGNMTAPGAPPAGTVVDQGEAMALTNFTSGAVQDGNGVLTAPTAGQFGGSVNSQKKITGGAGLRGFIQAKMVNSGANGSFFGVAPTDGGFTNLSESMLLINGKAIFYENGAGVQDPQPPVANNDVVRIELYGPDAASASLPNGGAKYWIAGALVYTSVTPVPFPVFADFGMSNDCTLSELRIGGPGLTA